MPEDSHIRIHDLAEQDRPREKLLLHGSNSLTDSELLGILINSGIGGMSAVELGKKMLSDYGDNLVELGKASVKQLQGYKGIGEARAITIVAALELGKRRASSAALDRSTVSSSLEAFEILHPNLADLDHEELRVLMLNSRNKLLANIVVGKGGLSSTLGDVRLIMREALAHSATGIILAHNHPSGTLKPSKHDDELTSQVKKAGEIMDIRLRDHIIIVPDGYDNKMFYSYYDHDRL